MKRILAALPLVLLPGIGWAQATTPVNPRPCAISQVATGGTAVVALSGPTNGFFISNGATATDQGIGAAETIYVDVTGGAPAAVSNGTVQGIAAGAAWSWTTPYDGSATVKVNAATSGHKFTCLRW